MAKGIAIGLLIAFIGFGIYGLFLQSGEPPLKTVEELKAEVAPEKLDLARADPKAALVQAKPENYPVFIAFLDLDVTVTQAVADDYRQIFNRVAAYYGNDTPAQVVQAVFRIYEAKQYFYTLTYRQCLEYIQDTVPSTFDPATSDTKSPTSIREVAEEINQFLVASYMAPQLEAMKAKQANNERLQQSIDENLAAHRAAGEAKNAAQAQAQAEYNARVQRNLDWEFNQYRANTVNNALSYSWNWRY